ncbi:MAG: proteasome assembly chaperone family protein [Candidatus Aenigmatarchaeota archaeon]
MHESEITVEEKVKLRNPLCIVGLPGIGNIGRIGLGYIVSHSKAKRFARLYSPYFFPFVMVHDNRIHVLRNEFYALKGAKRDYILLIGDCQTYDPKGHYEIAGKVVDFVKSLGCKEIITIGGFSTGKIKDKPAVYGVASHDEIKKKLKEAGVDTNVAGKVSTIVGAAGLMLGVAKVKGLKGFTLLGETSGFPIITDPNAAEAVLEVLQKFVDIKIDLTKLKEKVAEMHDFISKLHNVQMQAMEQMQRPSKPEDKLRYIG